MNEISVRIENVTYLVNDDSGHSVRVLVNEDGKLTINTHDGHDKFWFCCSNPERVAAIGRLFIKASELCKYRIASIDEKL